MEWYMMFELCVCSKTCQNVKLNWIPLICGACCVSTRVWLSTRLVLKYHPRVNKLVVLIERAIHIKNWFMTRYHVPSINLSATRSATPMRSGSLSCCSVSNASLLVSVTCASLIISQLVHFDEKKCHGVGCVPTPTPTPAPSMTNGCQLKFVVDNNNWSLRFRYTSSIWYK